MAAQQQFSGNVGGYRIGYPKYTTNPESDCPWCKPAMRHGEQAFVVIFLLELSLKLLAYRKDWFKSWWNYLDAIVVFVSLVSWIDPFGWGDSGGKLTFARTARFG